MKTKLITMLTAFCLVTTTALGGLTTVAYADDAVSTDTQPVPKTQSIETEYIRDAETGHIYPANELEIPTSKEALANHEGRNRAVLPSLYPPGDAIQIMNTYPATRSQSPYGTCWSHASLACAEFDLVKNHGIGRTVDLSELQLAYFTYHTANDRLGNLNGDQIYIPNTAAENYLEVGGNSVYAMQTLAQWKGLTYEGNIPYSNAANSLNYGIESWRAQQNDGAKMENAYLIDIKKNPSAVKEAIQTYGAVDVSYYHDSQYYALSNGYALYYCPDSSLGTNHDVAIVGWNDNLPASVFPAGNRPTRNGGWLIRNSWSTANNGSESCYFWMSYEDKSLANNATVMDFVPGSKYANIYQHDGTSSYNGLGVEKAANVFTAQNPDGAGSEVLQAVMLTFMWDADVSYQIDIYTGLPSGTTTNPESGYHHSYATTTGTTTHAGVHTVYLKQPVYLAPGEKYAIVVTSKSGQRYFTTEYTEDVTYQENGNKVSWFSCTANAEPGESFYKVYASYDGWSDAAKDALWANGNFRIKGLTVNSSAKKYTVSYNLNGGKVASGNPEWYLSTDGVHSLNTPTKDGYHFLGWYADSNYTQKIDAISGSLGRNLTLYARWGAHNYVETVVKRATTSKEGLLNSQCTGCSDGGEYYILIPKVSLGYSKTIYSGKAKRPKVTVKTENGKLSSSLYTVSYSNNVKVGRAKVIIKLDPTYYNVTFTKYYSIVPKAPASVTAKLNGDYNNIKVTWKKSTGADGYYVYYKKASASKYSTKNRIATTKLSKTFKNLNNGVKYTFKVVPYFKKGDTKYTSTKYKTATATTLKKLKQPSMSKKSGGRVYLQWQSISGASGYQVYWSVSKNGKYKKLCDFGKENIGVTFSVGKGETYWYKTRAYQKVNKKKIYGPWSEAKKYKR